MQLLPNCFRLKQVGSSLGLASRFIRCATHVSYSAAQARIRQDVPVGTEGKGPSPVQDDCDEQGDGHCSLSRAEEVPREREGKEEGNREDYNRGNEKKEVPGGPHEGLWWRLDLSADKTKVSAD